jgi:hypothetical protein
MIKTTSAKLANPQLNINRKTNISRHSFHLKHPNSANQMTKDSITIPKTKKATASTIQIRIKNGNFKTKNEL